MKKLILKIKMLFSVLTTWFASMLSKNDEIVKMVAPFAVNICNFIKEFNGSSPIESIKQFIESTGNTYLKSVIGVTDKLLTDENMDKVIAVLNIASKAASATNVADKLTIILNYIKSLETDKRKIAWTTLSAMIASDLSDGKLSWQELYSIVQGIYEKKLN
jgi:hypothetical protein